MTYYMPELDISSVTTKLHQLSNEELKQLLNDESYQQLDEMIKDLPQVWGHPLFIFSFKCFNSSVGQVFRSGKGFVDWGQQDLCPTEPLSGTNLSPEETDSNRWSQRTQTT